MSFSFRRALVPWSAIVALFLAQAAQAQGVSADAARPEARPIAVAAAPAAGDGRGPVTSLPLPRFVSLRAETANARRGPSLTHRVDWAFQHRGWPLRITAEYGHWRRVSDVDGAGGWVHHSLLSGVRMVVLRGDGLLALHASPSEAARITAYAEPGVVARLDSCEDGWCRIAADGADGWISRPALWGIE
ncbi:SH3 domain-containing protein [soil metagenome]